VAKLFVVHRCWLAGVGDPSDDMRSAVVSSCVLSGVRTGSAFVLRKQVTGTATSWHSGNAAVSIAELLWRELVSNSADQFLWVVGGEVAWGENALTDVFGVVINSLQRVLSVHDAVGGWLTEAGCGKQRIVDSLATDDSVHRTVSTERVVTVIGCSISVKEL